MAKKNKMRKFTKVQLDALYECWKDADNYKDRLALIEERLPKIPSLSALKKMRKLARTDTKWLKWATRQKNALEREKLTKKKEKERKKEDVFLRRVAREERKKLKKEKSVEKSIRDKIGEKLLFEHAEKIGELIEPQYFFCTSTHQYINNISCIYRLFSNEYNFSPCDKCSKMDKHIPILMEVIKHGRQKRVGSDKASEGRKTKIKGSKTRKTKTRKATKNK